jgi:uncharacterized protein YjeT (DUF2065 family)
MMKAVIGIVSMLFLAIGLVLVVEGLAYALAPSFIRRMAEQLPRLEPMNSCVSSASPHWRSASEVSIWRGFCERSRDCSVPGAGPA